MRTVPKVISQRDNFSLPQRNYMHANQRSYVERDGDHRYPVQNGLYDGRRVGVPALTVEYRPRMG